MVPKDCMYTPGPFYGLKGPFVLYNSPFYLYGPTKWGNSPALPGPCSYWKFNFFYFSLQTAARAHRPIPELFLRQKTQKTNSWCNVRLNRYFRSNRKRKKRLMNVMARHGKIPDVKHLEAAQIKIPENRFVLLFAIRVHYSEDLNTDLRNSGTILLANILTETSE